MPRLVHGKDFSTQTSQGGFVCHTSKHDDGTPWVIHLDVVMIKLNDGSSYYLPNGYVTTVRDEDGYYQTIRSQYDPHTMVEKVIKKGVDLTHWLKYEEKSFEERMAEELMWEEKDRMVTGGW